MSNTILSNSLPKIRDFIIFSLQYSLGAIEASKHTCFVRSPFRVPHKVVKRRVNETKIELHHDGRVTYIQWMMVHKEGKKIQNIHKKILLCRDSLILLG